MDVVSQAAIHDVWRRVNEEAYVREIVGQPDATLHQAMLRFPGSDHMLELIDYRGVDRTPVDTNPVNPGTAHICVLGIYRTRPPPRCRGSGCIRPAG